LMKQLTFLLNQELTILQVKCILPHPFYQYNQAQ
jgi:hypothetical protein